MTSAHRYPPPPPNSQNDFRLPSLKDLNFYRPSGAQPALPPSQQQELPNVQPEQPPHPTRHPPTWSRSAYQPAQLATPTAHQQYTPASHEVSPKLEYTPKHENIGYAHPGVPLSVQANSATNSAGMVSPRNEDASHPPTQPKRQRTAPNSAASRDTRASHPSVYPHPQYPSYPQGSQPPSASPYPSVAPSLPPTPSHPAPSSHEQLHHHPHSMSVTAHPGYAYPAYVQPRQTLLHPPNSSQISQHNHSNSYPPSAPPPPPPQGPWSQSHSQQPPTQFQQPPPPPQHPQHNPHPAHAPSHHHQHQHHHQPQASMPASSNQPVPAHHHQQQQPPPPSAAAPPNPPPSQQVPPSVQYHPHQHQYQNQYPHPPQPQQHQQQAPPSFVRPTAINPSSLENRPTYHVAEPPRVSSVPNDAMSEITDHCNVLYNFANQYVTLQQSNPHAQPPPGELEEMSQRALKVVRLLNDFRRICIPESTQMQTSPTASALASDPVAPMQTDSPVPGESSRPPKRPWEDTQEDDVPPVGDVVGFQDQFPANPSPDPKNQSTAEQDMELIRTKRATTTAIANGSSGQPKSKYRKRSMGQRASPPGKCHSCNIRETPEWRRGPDGARTLCNACGLHYAKLMRKQNKAAGNGDAPHIDLETLRASTRAADIAEKGRNPSSNSKQTESSSSPSSKPKNKIQQNSSDANGEASTSGTATPAPSQTHQGSFQLVNMMAPPQDHHLTQNHGHGPPPIQSSSSSTVQTPMPVDSRPTSQHASTPQLQTIHAPPPSSAPSHHSNQHPQHHPPWPTTAATTGAAAAASGVVTAPSTTSVRRGASGGSAPGPSFGNPPPHSPVDFIRRQCLIPSRGNQQRQPTSR